MTLLMLFISVEALSNTPSTLWVTRHFTRTIQVNLGDEDNNYSYSVEFPSRQACEQKIDEIVGQCIIMSKEDERFTYTDNSLTVINEEVTVTYEMECK